MQGTMLTGMAVVQVVAVDPGQRGVSEGVQVMAGGPFLLQHCATKQVTSLCNLVQPSQQLYCPQQSQYIHSWL